jgi:hypothetical protein
VQQQRAQRDALGQQEQPALVAHERGGPCSGACVRAVEPGGTDRSSTGEPLSATSVSRSRGPPVTGTSAVMTDVKPARMSPVSSEARIGQKLSALSSDAHSDRSR